MSARTALGSRLKTSGLNSNDGCRVFQPRGAKAGAEIDHRIERDLLRRETCRRSRASASRLRACGATACSRAPTSAACTAGPVIVGEVLHAPWPGRGRRTRRRRTGPERSSRRAAGPCPGLLLVPLVLRRVLAAGRLPRQEHAALRCRADRPAPTASRRTGPSLPCRPASPRDCASRTRRSASAAPSCRAAAAVELDRLLAPRLALLAAAARLRPCRAPADRRAGTTGCRRSRRRVPAPAAPAAFLTTSVSGFGRTSTSRLADLLAAPVCVISRRLSAGAG